MNNNGNNTNWKNRLRNIFQRSVADDEDALKYLRKTTTDGAGTKTAFLFILLNLESQPLFLYFCSFHIRISVGTRTWAVDGS